MAKPLQQLAVDDELATRMHEKKMEPGTGDRFQNIFTHKRSLNKIGTIIHSTLKSSEIRKRSIVIQVKI